MKFSEFLSIVVDELEDLKKDIADNMIKANEVASGDTIRSMKVTETSSGAMLTGRNYFQSTEKGRAGGRVPFRFQDIIAKWVKDKGINLRVIPYKRRESAAWHPKYTPEQRALNSFSYLVSRKIRKQGTSLFRKGGREDIYTNAIDKKLPIIKDKIQEFFKIEIQRL